MAAYRQVDDLSPLWSDCLYIGISSGPKYEVSEAFTFFRSTPPSRPNNFGLKCPSARPYVRPSVHKKFLRVMHDGMQYDPIKGQSQGHEPLKVGKSAIFKGYLLPHL